MSYTAPTVNYSATLDGTYTSLTGVQSISITRGKQRYQDNFSQNTCVIELIPASSYTLPLAINQYIDIRDANTSTSPCYFAGVITDVQRSFDIPFNSVTGSAPNDRIIITATGATGKLGSTQYVNFSIDAREITYNLFQLCVFGGITTAQIDNNAQNSAQTISSSALDAINTLLRTGQMVVDDYDMHRTVSVSRTLQIFTYPIGQDFGFNLQYGDTGPGQRFKTLQYLSSVENSFNRVQVKPAGLATQTVSGTGPFNTLVYDTWNASTNDASNLANYIFNLFSSQTQPVPFTIGTDTIASPNCMTVVVLPYSGNLKSAIGQTAELTFRGTTVSGQIQGFNANFYVDRASVQLYFAPTLGTPFTLDSTIVGILDTNRLGYP